ncbi:hypothetical protein [Halolamina sp. C58]|uniref:hypothetical protein n=1 Tax=Halolamina sp. C58 TaxID=3421640 RepID=UPI003EBD0782
MRLNRQRFVCVAAAGLSTLAGYQELGGIVNDGNRTVVVCSPDENRGARELPRRNR